MAIRAFLGIGLHIAAMMAFEHLIVLMVGKAPTAGWAFEDVAAMRAVDPRPITAAIDQQKNLFFLIEFLADGLQ